MRDLLEQLQEREKTQRGGIPSHNTKIITPLSIRQEDEEEETSFINKIGNFLSGVTSSSQQAGASYGRNVKEAAIEGKENFLKATELGRQSKIAQPTKLFTDPYSSLQESNEDRAKYTSGVLGGTMGVFETLASPITGALAPLLEKGATDSRGDSTLLGAGLEAFVSGMELGGKAYQGLYKSQIGDRELTELEDDITKYIGGEAAAGLITFGAVKGTTSSIKGIGKISSTINNKINWGGDKLDNKIDSFLNSRENDMSVLGDRAKYVEEFTNDVRDFLESVKKNTAGDSDVDWVRKKYGLEEGAFFKQILEDANKTNIVNKTIQEALFAGYYGKSTAKQIKEIDNISSALKKAEYDFSKKMNVQRPIVDSIKKTLKVSDDKISEVLRIRKDFYADDIEVQFNTIRQINDLKKQGDVKDLKDTFDAHPKTDAAIRLEEGGYVKIIDQEGREYSVQLTKKGEQYIDKQNIDPYIKDLIKKDGIAHIPKNITDYVKGNTAQKGLEIKKILDGTEELRNIGAIYNRMLSGVTKRTDFSALKGNLLALNERFKLGMAGQIDELFDTSLGTINSVRVGKVVDQIVKFRQTSFLTIKNIKFPTPKNIKQRMFGEQKLNDIVYKEGGKAAEIKYKSDVKIITDKYSVKFSTLAKQKNKLGDRYKMEVDELNRIRREELIQLNTKFNKIKETKLLIKQQLSYLFKNKTFIGDVQKVGFSKVINNKKFNEASTPAQIESVVTGIYKDLSVKYGQALKAEIGKELNIGKVSKSSSRAKKEAFTVRDRIRMETYRNIFSADKTKMSIEEMEGFLSFIKAEKQFIKKQNEGIVLERNKANVSLIQKIKDEGIAYLKGTGNIADKELIGFTEHATSQARSFRNSTLFIPRVIEKIFGRDGIAYNKFVKETDYNYSLFENFYQKRVEPAVVLLHKLLKDDVRDFGVYKFITQKQYINNEIKYPGLERFIYDEVEKGKAGGYLSKRETESKYNSSTDLPADFPLPYREWEQIKDLKVGEIIEQYNTDRFTKSGKVWDNVFGDIGINVKRTAEDLGIDISLRDGYVPFKIKNTNVDINDLEFGQDMMLQNKIQDGFLESIINNKGAHYEYNPLTLLITEGRRQSYFSYMAKHFDDLKTLANGRTFSIKDISETALMEHIKNPEGYRFIDGNGKTVKPEARDGIIYDKDSGSIIDLDGMRMSSKKGLMDEVSPEGQYYISSFLETVSRGGHIAKSTPERIVTKIVNHANLLPLIGGIGVILKQGLVTIDALGVKGAREGLFNAFRDLARSPEANKAISEVPAVAGRGGGVFLTKEVATITPKGLKGATMYYKEYLKIGTYGMRVVDEYFYGRIYYSAYKNFLVENGLAKKSDIITTFKNKEAIKYANDIANRTASTANPLWMPDVYKHPIFKSFFGIFTTQLNRVQEYSGAMKNAYKENNFSEMTLRSSMFFIQNAAEVGITYGVGKFLYNIGASNYSEYERDVADLFFSLDTLYTMTLGQTFIGTKASSLVAGFSPSPVLGFGDKISTDLLRMWTEANNGNPDKVMENFTNLLTTSFGGAFARYVVNAMRNF